jgi:replicative DNA helicase
LVQTPPRLNRIPPHNLDAEQSVLGAMLESKEAIANVIEVVESDDFYKPSHALIYGAILDLYGAGQPADAITVAEELARRGQLDTIGGRPYILGLLEAYPTASSAGRYARIVEDHSLLRRLIDAGNQVQEIGFSMPETVEGAVDRSEEIIYQVGDRRLRDDVQPINKLLVENMEAIEALYDRGEHVTGLASGFPDLDEMTAGFHPSNLIIVAARPSMGKCLSGAALVVDPDSGRRLSLEEFVERRTALVAALDAGGSIRPAPVADWIRSGAQECCRLVTGTGRTLAATPSHPLLTISGWVPLADLRPGARIAVARSLAVFGCDASWSLERVRLLGHLLAGGDLAGGEPRLAGADPEIRSDFESCLLAEFPGCFVGASDARTLGMERGPEASSPAAWLEGLGLSDLPAAERGLPACVWTWDRTRLAELLRSLFSWGTAESGAVRCTFASPALADDVHHALVRFGIVGGLRHRTAGSWCVEVTEAASLARFARAIGRVGRGEEDVPPDEPGLSGEQLPPEIWDLVRKAAETAGLLPAELARMAGEAGDMPTSGSIARARLARYAEILESDDLRWLANEDLLWDEVVSIEPIGERMTYDLTVPEGSNFVAQDVCVHNSALMSDFALNAAVQQNRSVVIFSLEMSRHEMVQRFLSSQGKVDSQRLRRGSLQEQDWTRLSSALGRLAEAPIFIDDSASVTLMEMRAKCRRLKAKHGLGLILIDYLQLMQSPRRSENRQQEVSEISRSLKILAKELGVPVICASQLNRGVEYRADKRPLLGDLRESGAIEQDADLVMFLYRDEVYNPDTEEKGEAELHVAKHRNGPTGKVRLAFMSQYTRFASFARGHNF